MAKYTVNVKDKTTPAVDVRGKLYEGQPAYVFYMEYAQIRAEEISTNYSHTRPGNKDKSLDGLYFIENIAYGQKTPEAVVKAWMNSKGHKATLLSDYSEVGNRMGAGCFRGDDGKIYWTQEFVGWDSEG